MGKENGINKYKHAKVNDSSFLFFSVASEKQK